MVILLRSLFSRIPTSPPCLVGFSVVIRAIPGADSMPAGMGGVSNTSANTGFAIAGHYLIVATFRPDLTHGARL